MGVLAIRRRLCLSIRARRRRRRAEYRRRRRAQYRRCLRRRQRAAILGAQMARPRAASFLLAWAVTLLSQATGGDIDEHCRSAGEGAYEACVFERLDSEVCPAFRLAAHLRRAFAITHTLASTHACPHVMSFAPAGRPPRSFRGGASQISRGGLSEERAATTAARCGAGHARKHGPPAPAQRASKHVARHALSRDLHPA